MNGASTQTISMAFDIGVVFIVLLTIFIGWRKGFAGAVFGLLRWFICIGVSIFGAKPAASFISAKTTIDESMTAHIKNAMAPGLTESSWFKALPSQLSHVFDKTAQDMASSIADTVMTVIAFFSIFIILYIITAVIAKSLERKDKDGPVDFINGFLGGVLGGVKGILIVSLIMLVFFPIMGMAKPDASGALTDGLRGSDIASIIYDHNPITMIIQALK